MIRKHFGGFGLDRNPTVFLAPRSHQLVPATRPLVHHHQDENEEHLHVPAQAAAVVAIVIVIAAVLVVEEVATAAAVAAMVVLEALHLGAVLIQMFDRGGGTELTEDLPQQGTSKTLKLVTRQRELLIDS